MGSKAKTLAELLAGVPDPRKVRGQRHVLLDIILIAILGTLSSVDDWEGIEEFAKDQEAWLRTFLELPHGIPSHDTFNRVFRLLDPQAFGEDGLRTRMGNGPETGAILRHITLNMLRQDPNTKRSIRHRRLKAALSQEYRLAALLGFPADQNTTAPSLQR